MSKESSILTLNVVSIVIGVLIVRIVVEFFILCKTFSESCVDYDLEEQLRDKEELNKHALNFTFIFAACGFVIICIFSWYLYRSPKKHQKSNGKQKVK